MEFGVEVATTVARISRLDGSKVNCRFNRTEAHVARVVKERDVEPGELRGVGGHANVRNPLEKIRVCILETIDPRWRIQCRLDDGCSSVGTQTQ